MFASKSEGLRETKNREFVKAIFVASAVHGLDQLSLFEMNGSSRFGCHVAPL